MNRREPQFPKGSNTKIPEDQRKEEMRSPVDLRVLRDNRNLQTRNLWTSYNHTQVKDSKTLEEHYSQFLVVIKDGTEYINLIEIMIERKIFNDLTI